MKTSKLLIFLYVLVLAANGMLLPQTKSGKSDLQFRSIILNKTRIQQGGSVTIRLSLLKEGDATAPFVINFYLSKSASPKFLSADKRIFRIPVPAQAKGRIPINKSKTYKTSSLIKSGSYYIMALIDPMNRIKELNENNNQGSIQLTVQPYTPTFNAARNIPKPDIELHSFFMHDLRADGSVQITIYLKNKGATNIKNLGYEVKITKEVRRGSWFPYGSRKTTYPGVIPIGDTLLSINATVSMSNPSGSSIKFCVNLDPDDLLKESDERNNYKCYTYRYR